MGLEAYLFQIEFSKPIAESAVISLFEKVNMKCLDTSDANKSLSEFRSYYFEQRSPKGLVEAHVIFAPSENSTEEFSLRFSILSPKSVVEQTFEILSNLHSIIPIRVFDTEISNHIYRQLRKEGVVDKDFEGIENTEQEAEIRSRCYIPIDTDLFAKNALSIHKRNLILSNEKGEVIESGSKTINHIEKKGIVDRFIYWIKKEL